MTYSVPVRTIPLVLGSSSPRRLALLQQAGITPDHVIAPDIDETPRSRETPAAYCRRIALEKNAALSPRFPDAFILTADSTAAVGRRILGKPADRAEAEAMLRLMSGRAHHLLTAVVLRLPDGKILHRLSDSRVRLKRLSEPEITAHLDTGNWQGCAGAYRFLDGFEQYVTGMTGSVSGIVGLPLFETMQMLKGSGYVTAS